MKKLMFASLAALVFSGVFAEEKSAVDDHINSILGLGIAAPLQFPKMSDNVYGLRLGLLMAYNNEIAGVDVSPVAIAEGDVMGVEAGLFNWGCSDVWGLQIGALANVVAGNSIACHIAAANVVRGDAAGLELSAVNYANSFKGLQIGALVNWNRAASLGAQVAAVNVNSEYFTGFSLAAINNSRNVVGFQLGAFNLAERMTGLQIGVFNAAYRMEGVQIGVLNMICENYTPVLPIANASF